MDFDAAENNILTTAEAAWLQVQEFAVSYALSILGAIILILVGFIAAGILARWTRAALGRLPGVDETLRRFLSKIVRYAVLILVGVTVLAQFGVQTASIIAALGAVGLAIGLALQGTLQNIAAGIMLLALKPFRVGEYIDAGGIAGTVEEIGLFATELQSADGVYVMAPNSELWNKAVTNYSRNALRRNDIAIGIGYEDDIDLAQELLLKLAQGDQRVLAVPAPETFVGALGDSAVMVTVRYWTATTDYWAVRFDITKAAKQAFDANGISIPFPQRQIHFVQGEDTPPRANTSQKAAAG
ncbi:MULTISPECIES: mechanosensitive ion channel family protein [Chelativorans]|jgi:small conductance mechanosensitive channel|uniref:Small-conductance mechanosensitive channel n=1 Tax=Chelativorans sp. (strain BNC1) TaxID=266779 RepID=Q11JS3_CHESB|nr:MULTISPECIES: mechanosensitive ion channel domain-containing protein [Chelativorans]